MNAREITAALKGRWHGQYGFVRCVAHDDGRPSLRIRDGERQILVHCYAGCDPTHVLDQLRCQRLLSGPELSSQAREEAQRRQAQADARREAERRRKAFQMWNKAHLIGTTPAALYLRNRGISIPLPASLRYASLPHPDAPGAYSCLLAAVQDHQRTITGVQRIYVTATGQKAPLPTTKLSLGTLSGAAVRLAASAEEMAVGEGLETCLSFMQITGLPTWAALSTSGFRSFYVPPIVTKLHILVDNDENGAGEKAADELAARCGIETVMRRSSIGKDWNDELMATVAPITAAPADGK